MKIYYAPLEGITGYIYRNAYKDFYGKVDKFYAPFISPADRCPMVAKDRKDLAPENNKGIYLVPQILTRSAEHFNEAVDELKDMGYNEINLNLGCPSGTVCAKGKGAGFLPDTDELKAFLDNIYSYGEGHDVKLSIKTRLGYFNPDEFYDLVEIFNEFPVSELIIHPRIRADFYKGEPRYEYYKYALEHAKMPLVYNGNIFEARDYTNLANKIRECPDAIMLGRGLIGNPSLVASLQEGKEIFDNKRFWDFHDRLYHEYQQIMSPDINVLYRMKELWTYWKGSFEDIDRDVKRIMKSKKFAEYESAIAPIRG